MTDSHEQQIRQTKDTTIAEPVRAVLDALEKLRFGAINLTVHEGKLVQIDVTERKRFSN